jgi:serine/threonine-protein kinase
VERVLGVGGMGVVVAAHHLQLDEKVALKFLLPDALSNAEAVARFAREARAAVKIKSEHVARVSDVGTLPNGAPYMVMEYLEGGDLEAWIKDRGPLPVEQAVEFVLQACEALAEAHAVGIVHRDLKPANLFCVRRADGLLSIKVLDFGISKMSQLSGSAQSAMTQVASLMGSPLYMSPEQMKSAKDVNPQTDIWAMGIVLFELLSGRLPFLAESLPELFYRVATEPPPSLRGIRPEVPEELEAVVARCLEKDRANRYPNVGDLAVALLPFAPTRGKISVDRISGIMQASGLSQSGLSLPRPTHVGGTLGPSGTGSPVTHTKPGTPAPSPGRGVVVGIAIAGVLAAAVASAVILHRSGGGHSVAAASSPPPVVATASVASPPPPAPAAENAATSAPAVAASAAPVPEAASPEPVAPSPVSRPAAPSPRPARTPPVVAAPAALPAHRPNVSPPSGGCDPPFTLDDQGHRHYKPECYLNK